MGLSRRGHLIATTPQKLYHLKNTSMYWNPDSLQQQLVLLETIRDEHVLERLPLLRDFDIAIALATLHLVVVVDEQPVEERMLAENLLNQDQAAVRIQPAVDARQQRFAMHRPDELERQDEQRYRGILEVNRFVQIFSSSRPGQGKCCSSQASFSPSRSISCEESMPTNSRWMSGLSLVPIARNRIGRRAAEIVDRRAVDAPYPRRAR